MQTEENNLPTKSSSVTPKLAWSIGEIAESTNLSSNFLRNEIKNGNLPAKRFGRRILVLDADLKTYITTGSTGEKDSINA